MCPQIKFTTINNVAMYEVDLLTETVPEFFRSGMNASVNFISGSKENTLVIPDEALFSEKGEDFVFVKDNSYGRISKRKVKMGISQDKKVEIVSGLDVDDTVVIKSRKYLLPIQEESGGNPFMPRWRQQRRQ